MTRTPYLDTVIYENNPAAAGLPNTKATADVVVAVNPDGSPIAGGGGTATTPTIVGGEYTTVPPTIVTGGTDSLQLDSRGSLRVALISTDGTNTPVMTATSSDGVSATAITLAVRSHDYVFNGTTWDRARGDTVAAYVKTPPLIATSRSITATTTSQQLMAANTTRTKFIIKNDTAIVVWINIGATAVASAGSGNISIAANGGYLELTGTSGAINIIAASTTAAITAYEF